MAALALLLTFTSIGAPSVVAQGEACGPSCYAAHVAAASQALELHRTTEALRWLEGAPEALRGWEWGYLQAQAGEHSSSWEEPGAPVDALAVSSDGRLLAGCAEDGKVLLWDLERGAFLRSFDAHEGGCWALAFSPDGSPDGFPGDFPGRRRLASTGADKTVRLWDLDPGVLVASRTEEVGNLTELAWRPDGSTLAVGAWDRDPETRVPRGFALLYPVEREKGSATGLGEPLRLVHGYLVSSVAWSPDGTRLAAGTWNGTSVLWELAEGETLAAAEARTLEAPESEGYPAIQQLTFSPDGKLLAQGTKEGTVRLWDAESLALVGTLSDRASAHRAWVNGLAFSPDGKLLATASSDLTVRLWEVERLREARAFHGHTGAVSAVAFSGPETLFSGGADGTVRSWPVPRRAEDGSLRLPGQLAHPGEDVWGFVFAAGGERAATVSSQGKVRVWDIGAGRVLWQREGHTGEGCGVAVSPDARHVVSSANDGRLRVWEAASGEPVRTLEEVPDGRAVGIAFSPDGRQLAAASSRGTAKVWPFEPERLAGSELVEPLFVFGGSPEEAHRGEIWRVLWSPDGALLATVASDGVVKLWKAEDGAPLASWQAHGGQIHGAVFSPDSTAGKGRLATASRDRTVRVWSIPSGELLGVLEGHAERVYDVAWSPDGARLVSVSEDFTARLWDASTFEALLLLPFRHQVYQAAWSADGRTLAISPMDGVVRLLSGGPVETGDR